MRSPDLPQLHQLDALPIGHLFREAGHVDPVVDIDIQMYLDT
jgi:hypothetical protein